MVQWDANPETGIPDTAGYPVEIPHGPIPPNPEAYQQFCEHLVRSIADELDIPFNVGCLVAPAWPEGWARFREGDTLTITKRGSEPVRVSLPVALNDQQVAAIKVMRVVDKAKVFDTLILQAEGYFGLRGLAAEIAGVPAEAKAEAIDKMAVQDAVSIRAEQPVHRGEFEPTPREWAVVAAVVGVILAFVAVLLLSRMMADWGAA